MSFRQWNFANRSVSLKVEQWPYWGLGVRNLYAGWVVFIGPYHFEVWR